MSLHLRNATPSAARVRHKLPLLYEIMCPYCGHCRSILQRLETRKHQEAQQAEACKVRPGRRCHSSPSSFPAETITIDGKLSKLCLIMTPRCENLAASGEYMTHPHQPHALGVRIR